MYPADLVRPMSEELTLNGFKGLTTPEEVKELLEKNEGTVLLVVNSVCGCAAANARPGARIAAQNTKKPDVFATVFAGVDTEAVQQMRSYIPFPPSSPAIAIFKNGEVVHFIERHHIEGRSAEMIATHLVAVLEEVVGEEA